MKWEYCDSITLLNNEIVPYFMSVSMVGNITCVSMHLITLAIQRYYNTSF